MNFEFLLSHKKVKSNTVLQLLEKYVEKQFSKKEVFIKKFPKIILLLKLHLTLPFEQFPK